MSSLNAKLIRNLSLNVKLLQPQTFNVTLEQRDPIEVTLYPNIKIKVKITQSSIFNIKLKYPTTILNVIAPAANVISTGTIFVSNSIIVGNTLIANGSSGAAGQILTSNGSGIYWADPAQTYETVNKNLKSYDASYTYSGEILQSILYTISPVSSITKTFNYSNNVISSIVLSGSTPQGIDLTKTLNYSNGFISSIVYS
jgi:hypothetical protein